MSLRSSTGLKSERMLLGCAVRMQLQIDYNEAWPRNYQLSRFEPRALSSPGTGDYDLCRDPTRKHTPAVWFKSNNLSALNGLGDFPRLSCFVDIFIDRSQDSPGRCNARGYFADSDIRRLHGAPFGKTVCRLVSGETEGRRQRYENACSILHRPPRGIGSRMRSWGLHTKCYVNRM